MPLSLGPASLSFHVCCVLSTVVRCWIMDVACGMRHAACGESLFVHGGVQSALHICRCDCDDLHAAIWQPRWVRIATDAHSSPLGINGPKSQDAVISLADREQHPWSPPVNIHPTWTHGLTRQPSRTFFTSAPLPSGLSLHRAPPLSSPLELSQGPFICSTHLHLISSKL